MAALVSRIPRFPSSTVHDRELKELKILIQNGTSANTLLLDKFYEDGATSYVHILVQGLGASFSQTQLDTLLERAIRKGVVRSSDLNWLVNDASRPYSHVPMVFLIQQGASFSRLNLDKLLEDMFRQGTAPFDLNFLLGQGASFSRISGLITLLEGELRKHERSSRNGPPPSPRVEFLLRQDAFSQLPCGFNNTIKNYYCKTGGTSIDFLLEHSPANDLLRIVEYIRNFETTTKIQDDSGYEADGLHWPKVVDGGPVRFLTNSIIHLKGKMPSLTTIIAEGQAITASKTMLTTQSPYFKTLFSPISGFQESAQSSFRVEEGYITMDFVIYYAETKPHKVDWLPFYPSQDLDATAEILDTLLDILCAADKFGMMHLHKDVQRQIVTNGTGFIWPENVSIVQDMADKWNGKLLSSYCKRFLKLNRTRKVEV